MTPSINDANVTFVIKKPPDPQRLQNLNVCKKNPSPVVDVDTDLRQLLQLIRKSKKNGRIHR